MDWLHHSKQRTTRNLVGLICFLLCADVSFAQQKFPYVAYVAQEGAYVRSGPGNRHYPTEQLQQGYAVEVYRHDGNGWCAIRPPEQSFSWIAAHEARPVNDQLAEIVAERAIARVGSSLSPTRSAVQVMLPQGEKVAFAPAPQNDDPHWLRIQAPAGEFRWIAASAISSTPPMEVTPPTKPASKWTQAKLQPEKETTPPTATSQVDAFGHLQGASPIDPPQGPGSNYEVAQSTSPQNPNAIEVIAGSPAETQLTQYQAPQTVTAPALVPGSPLPTSLSVTHNPAHPRIRLPGFSGTSAEKSEVVNELDVLLSQIVSQPHEYWQLDALRSEAELQLQQASSATERVQIHDLLQRITQFQQFQIEHRAPAPLPRQNVVTQVSSEEPEIPSSDNSPPVDQLQRIVANVRERVESDLRSPSRSTPNTITTAKKPKFDAVGKLKPVVSKREKAPPFALVDEKGEVVSFVTPTPDLNLQPYVGRRIGIHGNRGYMPEYGRAHVTAGRVLPVDDVVRR